MKDEKISNSLKRLNKLRDIINDDSFINAKPKNDMYGGILDKRKNKGEKYIAAGETNSFAYASDIKDPTYKKNGINDNDIENNIRNSASEFYEASEALSPLNISIIEEINESDKNIKGKSKERLRNKRIFSISVKIAAASIIIVLSYLIIISLYFKFSMRKLLTISNNYKVLNASENASNVSKATSDISDISKLKGLENLNLNLDIALLKKKNELEKNQTDNEQNDDDNKSNSKNSINNESKDTKDVKSNVAENIDLKKQIDVNTKFLFRTKYQEDFRVIKRETWPNHSEINLSIKELSEKYSDWNIVSFENNILTFEKSVQGKAPDYYLLKILGGKIAVYYVKENDELSLREVTSIETKGLEKQEILALEEGIYVYGEELLIRKLETYSS